MAPSVFSVLGGFYDDYKKTTPKKLKLVDAYMFCIMLTGIIQFVYCCLVGTFPFNAFLSGFISTVGCFVLAGKFRPLPCHVVDPLKCCQFIIFFYVPSNIASYRIQINKQNQGLFEGISSERAFADFMFAHVVLHLVVVNFIG